jgi:hypothetical protein
MVPVSAAADRAGAVTEASSHDHHGHRRALQCHPWLAKRMNCSHTRAPVLTSAQLDSASPLAVLLIGQPQLRASMRLGLLAALDQRIGVRYAMAPMTADETSSYLRHHTKLAGRSDQLFSDDAAELIHQASRGFPRAVNRLAAAALLATYTTHKTIADTTAVRAAITEVNDQ